MTRDYYPEFVVVVADGAYDIETQAVFKIGLHDPAVHSRDQAVELICRDLYEQGARKVTAGMTVRGLEITAEMVNTHGEVPKPLATPAGLMCVSSSVTTSDNWTSTRTYIYKEDPDVFKTLYRHPTIYRKGSS